MKIGIADTMFARVDMGNVAIETLADHAPDASIERYTVPGFKDLPVACKRLIERYKCDIVIALGWCGAAAIDETCAHEANMGLIQCELMTNTHILKVFIHETEKEDMDDLLDLAIDRVEKHTINAVDLATSKTALTKNAGLGKRQGSGDAGSIEDDDPSNDDAEEDEE